MSRFSIVLVWIISAVLTAGEAGSRLVIPAPASLMQRSAAPGSDELQWAVPNGDQAVLFSRAEVDGIRPLRLLAWWHTGPHQPGLDCAAGVWHCPPGTLTAAFLACPTLHEPLLI